MTDSPSHFQSLAAATLHVLQFILNSSYVLAKARRIMPCIHLHALLLQEAAKHPSKSLASGIGSMLPAIIWSGEFYSSKSSAEMSTDIGNVRIPQY